MIQRTLEKLSKRISSGITPFRGNAEFWMNGNIPWLKTEQLGERNIYQTNEHITDEALTKTSIKLNPINTISIAMYGEGRTRGNVSILRSKMTTNQACCNVVLDPSLADTDYIYYFLKNQYLKLRSLSSGVRKNLNSGDIRGFTINLPQSVDHQAKTVRILAVLDDKIELNNRINEELEGMAKLLYDYWFVQFDFPMTAAHAAALGKPKLKGQPYRASGGKMIYNKTLKREIPEGWKVRQLNEVGLFKNGINYSALDIGDTMAQIVNVRNMSSSSFFLKTSSLDEILLIGKSVKNYLVTEKSILIARSGIPGATRLIQNQKDNTIYCGFIICFEPHHKKDRNLVFFYMKRIEKAMTNNASGTVLKNVSQDTLKALCITSPIGNQEDDLLENFNVIIDPIFNTLGLLQQQTQELTELRDWLLPMLMNGQVTVA